MKSNKKSLFAILLFFFLINSVCYAFALQDESGLEIPSKEAEYRDNIPTNIDLQKVPDFPKLENTLKNHSQELTVSLKNKALSLEIDHAIDIKKAMVNDDFFAHLKNDFYISTEPPYLIIPKGTSFIGRVSLVKKPNLFKKTGEITVHIDQLVTPYGGFVFLDTDLTIQKNLNNNSDKHAGAVSKPLLMAEDATGLAVDFNDTALKMLGKLFIGQLQAISSQETNGSLYEGQELNIYLQKDLLINESANQVL